MMPTCTKTRKRDGKGKWKTHPVVLESPAPLSPNVSDPALPILDDVNTLFSILLVLVQFESPATERILIDPILQMRKGSPAGNVIP